MLGCTTENALEIRGLCKPDGSSGIKDLSFDVPAGCITGLVGPNGAGKTTIIKMILNMVLCDSGSIRFFGQDKVIRQNSEIGVVLDKPFYNEDWKVKDIEKGLLPFYPGWDFLASNIWACLVLGVFMGLVYNLMLFFYDEKNNTYVLYASLGLSRSSIVAGRFFSTLVLHIMSIVFCLPICALGYFVAVLVGFQWGLSFSPQIWILLSIIILLCTTVQFPVYFKVSYRRARYLAIAIPVLAVFLILGAVFGLILSGNNQVGSSPGPLIQALSSSGLMVVMTCILVVFACTAYLLSRSFLKKRDF
ncbi:MAG: ABC-2 transporter permease [Coriobacteriia bacterium]|nr:ABC-2 transporter permease [Coriobacteriia bacterium]